ncbi:MAG TPA: PLP-dependent aminotransferase family protein [Puia sp.]|nr:PLP-dependent aminotransferase family protein [Puia sp.]
MQLLSALIHIDEKADTPIYLQITNAFIHHIRSGRLRKGLKLPGSREVAASLGINRMTMVAAYDELQAQGWIEMLPRKGTFVKKDLPILSPRKIDAAPQPFTMPGKPLFSFDERKIVPVSASEFPESGKLIFNDGFPDSRLAPVEELIRSMRSFAKMSIHKKYLMYGGAQGTGLLRETLAEFLSDTRGLPITPRNILITRGAQMGIYIAASIVLDAGDPIIVGEPGYSGANLTFQQLGAKIYHVPVDGDGIDIDAVEKLCRTKKIRLVYVIPHHHNPTTVTLTPERRIRLLELSVKYKFAIIEDDYDYDFHYASKPMMPMASLDRHGTVVYIGTLTKTLAPAIRIGFMVAPESFIRHATSLRKALDTQGDSLIENAIAGLYKDGTMTSHIKKSVKLYKERRDHLCRLLREELRDHVSFKIPEGGMSVWTQFPRTDMVRLSRAAYDKGLIIKDGTEYDTPGRKYGAVRLGFAGLNTGELDRAVGILRRLI